MNRFLGFLGHNKFSIEITSIAVGGITVAELAFADLVLKIVIGVITLSLVLLKGYKEHILKK